MEELDVSNNYKLNASYDRVASIGPTGCGALLKGTHGSKVKILKMESNFIDDECAKVIGSKLLGAVLRRFSAAGERVGA